MADAVLVLNAGSSSLKFSVFLHEANRLTLALRGQLEALYTAPRFTVWRADDDQAPADQKAWPEDSALGHEGATAHLLSYLHDVLAGHRLVAAGHRVVHGGSAFRAPVRLDASIVDQLARLIPLAPLHQPHNIAAILALTTVAPDLAQVACFDTAFHYAMPALVQAYALPLAITERGVRRYGFHGLSYEYIASVLPQLDTAAERVVVAHLGNGASMCAMLDGKSVATTMGFTTLDGLPMGTRAGSLDPGVILYLMRELGMDANAIETLLYNHSGLLGVSGIASDMRTLLASSAPRARLAVDLFIYRIGRELGSLVAAIGGIDAMVFTGGIGEHASLIRERVLTDAQWLGFSCDVKANQQGRSRISTSDRQPTAWAIHTDEELVIARHTRDILLQ